MKKEIINLVFNSISLALTLLCAILYENSVVKGIWIVCLLIWGVRVIMDIREIIKRKKSQRGKTNHFVSF